MYGNGIARQLEEWHYSHNGQASDPEWRAFLEDFHDGLNVKMKELLEEHDNNGRFGMSKAGGCTRAAGLKLLGHEGEPFSGSTRVTFQLGHICEAFVISSLRACGYDVVGAQEPVCIDPFMHSYSDGLIHLPSGGAVLSVKSAGYKKSGKEKRRQGWTFVRRGFPELPFEGVRRAQPGHWAQMQAEMHGYQLAGRPFTQALYVVMSKDIIKAMEDDPYLGAEGNGSLTFYSEAVPYDQRFCEQILVPTWKAQWEAVQAGKAGPARYFAKELNDYVKLSPAVTEWQPNAGLTGTYNPCNYCDLLSECRAQLASDWRRA